MDLSKVEGLTADQIATLTTMSEESTAGLKSKVDELLGEKKSASAKAKEAETVAEQAREAAKKAHEEKLKQAGDMDALKAHYEEELASATAKAEAEAKTSQDNLDKYHKGNALNSALALVHDDFKDIANPMLSNMIKIGYDESGIVTTSFEHNGEVVAKNAEEFKGWASEQSTFKNILNGVDSSGAGSSSRSSASGGATNKPYNEMSLKEQIAHNTNVNPQRN